MNNQKKNKAIENLKSVLKIILKHSKVTIDTIYSDELNEQPKISKSTIQRKLAFFLNKNILTKEKGRPIIYSINPKIDQLILELGKMNRINLPNLAKSLEYNESELINSIRDFIFYGVLFGKIVAEDTDIYYLKS